MYLKLAIAGKVVASVSLNAREATNLEYLYSRRCLLTEACSAFIDADTEAPVYFIEVPSKMNRSLKN